MTVTFSINYNTVWGQWLCVSGSVGPLGGGIASKALQMEYQGDGWWRATIDLNKGCKFQYRYLVCTSEGVQVNEWGPDREVDLTRVSSSVCRLDDCWRASDDEKIFFSETFTKGFLSHTVKDKQKTQPGYTTTLQFRLNAARIGDNLCFAILGNIPELGNWQTGEAVVLSDHDFPIWSVTIDAGRLPEEIEYKYVMYDRHKHAVISWETGENRRLRPYLHDGDLYIKTDEYYRYAIPNWKAAGISIPIFSLRSKQSFGIGEYTDIAAFADWAKKAGLKVIQTLPINDTTRNHSNADAFPYTAISVTALHPIYVNPLKIGVLKDDAAMKDFKQKAAELNATEDVLYGKVLNLKMKYFKAIYRQDGAETLKSADFQKFVKDNDWLIPYAAFCWLRDQYKTADYTQWESNAAYHRSNLDSLLADSTIRKQLYFHIFIQYHAHLQLSAASRHVKSIGLILKGDIPIGISRESVEAWTDPLLFHLDRQAGAPPDPFSEVGQNWGFPTYNWDAMRQDNFAWW
ncbi:MAG: 4-alpha-glucanotransferase, partial [Paludibacteraceae bacterium]|nr:4-alpha-glucanotransferase [Paludibacteraceae bacterium]